jgi:hypothetical protein
VKTQSTGARVTALGSPCSKAWDDEWVAVVEAAEQEAGQRICGARTIEGVPCPLPPNHANGRCRFHGGFDLTGAPKGNRNAIIHGLYSRRLQVCGPHCAQWAKCPCAGEDVAAVAVTFTCPYEQAEYNTVVTDGLAHAGRKSPLAKHLVHTIALLQVMLSRASVAVREGMLTEDVHSKDSTVLSSKPSAALQAFLRIAGEYRRFVTLLERPAWADTSNAIEELPSAESVNEYRERCAHDADLEPAHQAEMAPEEDPAVDLAQRYLGRALDCAAEGKDVALIECFGRAFELAPELARAWQGKLGLIYRPKGGFMSRENVKYHLELVTGPMPKVSEKPKSDKKDDEPSVEAMYEELRGLFPGLPAMEKQTA